jgi:hypothetical protein
MAHKRAQMMHDMVVQPARQPAYHWVRRCIIRSRREDVIHPVFKLAATLRKVCAVHSVCRLKYQRYAQPANQMHHQERPGHQQNRHVQHLRRQHQHVGQVEGLPKKQDEIFPHRMLGLQIIVSRKEEALKVPDGKHSPAKTAHTGTAHRYAGSAAPA